MKLSHIGGRTTGNRGAILPPPVRCSYSVNYNNISKLSTLSNTGKHRGGRVVLFLPLLLCLMATACGKEEIPETIETLTPHPTWYGDSNNFWQNSLPCGLSLDTAWDGDTIIQY